MKVAFMSLMIGLLFVVDLAASETASLKKYPGPLPTTTPEGARDLLIPTLYDGPGVHGSMWSTDVVITNFNTTPFSSPGIKFGLLRAESGLICLIPEGCPSDSIPSGGTATILSPRLPAGLRLQDSSIQRLQRLFVSVRVAAAPRDPIQGTEIPVALDFEFGIGLRFPCVRLSPPGTGRMRNTLRLYELHGAASGAKITVRRWDDPNPESIDQKVYTFPFRRYGTGEPDLPGYLEIDLGRDFSGAVTDEGLFSVDVDWADTAGAPTSAIWGFISNTDNVTDEVTIVSPFVTHIGFP